LRAEREAPGRPSRGICHGYCCEEDHPVALARHSLQQALAESVERPEDQGGVSIEELAEDIARRGLLQGLSVRPVTNEAGTETGMFEIPAGGRRYCALELLVKQKRIARVAPVPCVVREDGIAEEDSLAENIQRAPLHPLDQFRAFLALREKGQSEEEIAAVSSSWSISSSSAKVRHRRL